MRKEYTHFPEEVTLGSETRTYRASERIIGYKERKVLLLEVDADGADSCDGCYVGSLTGVNVAGYVLKWKYKKNSSGEYVSQVEPINDATEQQALKNILKDSYRGYQINFATTV